MFAERNGRRVCRGRFAVVYLFLTGLEIAGFLWMTRYLYQPLGQAISVGLLLLVNTVSMRLLLRVWLATGRWWKRLLPTLGLAYAVLAGMGMFSILIDETLHHHWYNPLELALFALLILVVAVVYIIFWLPYALLAFALLTWVVRPVTRTSDADVVQEERLRNGEAVLTAQNPVAITAAGF